MKRENIDKNLIPKVGLSSKSFFLSIESFERLHVTHLVRLSKMCNDLN